MRSDLKISDFEYELPQEFIAKFPCEKRDESKLLVLDRNTGRIEHKIFGDVVDYLSPGDVLVVNKTKVIPARILGKKTTGGKMEILLLDSSAAGIVPAIVKPLKNLKPGSVITIGEYFCEVAKIDGETVKLRFSDDISVIAKKYGRVPLPPYIKRDIIPSDFERYQTVFASVNGSVAAPTAGLHFTEEVIKRVREKNVKLAEVLLHISWATFSPVRCENVAEHKMGEESFEIEESAAQAVNSAKRKIAVGTTSARVLEAVSDGNKIVPVKGSTDIFIYPGYEFKSVDALVTNFHLPRTTLLMLVCAFAGRDLILNAYEEAKKNNYRFASYGDAMLIL